MFTILTQPIYPSPWLRYQAHLMHGYRQWKASHPLTSLTTALKRLLLYRISPFPNKSTYQGHRGPQVIVDLLIQGLTDLKKPYTYNPSSFDKVHETVWVPFNLEALNQAIELKKNGKIKRLIAGPNLSIFPQEVLDLPGSDLIDLAILPSTWYRDWWLSQASSFPFPLKIWYAGIDPTWWQAAPNKPHRSKPHVLVYRKRCDKGFFKRCLSILEHQGLQLSILQYQHYTPEQYRNLLQHVDFAIFFSNSESQGLALFEAWSCNVPTLVWNRGFFEHGTYTGPASSAPYMTSQTGLCFKSEHDLTKKLKQMQVKTFSPRKWILQYGSYQYSTQRFLEFIAECV